MQCHSATAKKWVETHADSAEAIRPGEMNCIDCHNEIHPLALSRRPKTAMGVVR
jgi:nitrate/TMAO reductase-like tetraheme cytochrome c subunit